MSKIDLYEESRTVYEVIEEAMNLEGKSIFVTKPGNLICIINRTDPLKHTRPGRFYNPITFRVGGKNTIFPKLLSQARL